MGMDNDNSRPLRTAVFIDGAHLSVTTRHDFPGVAIAFDKLAALLAGPTELVRTYYYDADVWLSTDLVRLASKRQIDLAILVTGDSDFVPAIRAAREEGVEVRLLSSRSPRAVHPELAAAVDARLFLDDAMVQQTARRAA